MRSYSLCEKDLVRHRAGEVGERIGAVGGTLTVTSSRLVWEPSPPERLLGRRGWQAFHDEVDELDLSGDRPTGWKNWRTWRHLLNTGGGPVVAITDGHGTTHRLVARDPKRVLLDLRRHLPEVAAPEPAGALP